MDVAYFRTMFEYSAWARERLLHAVEQLPDAEYRASRPMDYGSVHGTLAHAYAADTMWLHRWHGESPPRMLTGDDLPSLAALEDAWREHDAALRPYLERLDDAQLVADVSYRATEGTRWTRPLWETMAHLINHGTNHRSEVAMVATQLGHSPGDLDAIVFFNERLRAAR